MQWIKDGVIFNGRLELNGRTCFIAGDPDPELMRAQGWSEYTPPAPKPAPKRYSKLKVIRALGPNWPSYKAQLEAGGLLDQFMAAQFLAEDDPVFATVAATLTDEEKAALAECEYTA